MEQTTENLITEFTERQEQIFFAARHLTATALRSGNRKIKDSCQELVELVGKQEEVIAFLAGSCPGQSAESQSGH